MAHYVKCVICGERFDRDKEPFVPIEGKRNRYAHAICFEKGREGYEKEQQDKANLEEYIKNLFNYETIPSVVYLQIDKFVKEKHFTYSGILKSLIYFYEVKHGDKQKANGRISIVEYIYNDAYKYYYNLWLAKEQNKDIVVSDYILPTKEITIKNPKRKPIERERQLFSFLEEDVNEKK